eukprot:CAMPEP_0197449918 /NCGR_PEP_ID=MMETSP1175-20131217/23342_1 /TAXON_ID=1003142 /ORGANISM="Triceratium dubium, Strain CCMP147" /LENGTH=123 /DNA_ID=CAMNT_0042982199 /DNA_START=66 /DNA_END=437 /DNA_ORIENTATION=+
MYFRAAPSTPVVFVDGLQKQTAEYRVVTPRRPVPITPRICRGTPVVLSVEFSSSSNASVASPRNLAQNLSRTAWCYLDRPRPDDRYSPVTDYVAWERRPSTTGRRQLPSDLVTAVLRYDGSVG